MPEANRVYHDLVFNGNLFSLGWAFLSAYDRRTSVMAIAAETNPNEVKALTARVKQAADDIEKAVEKSTRE